MSGEGQSLEDSVASKPRSQRKRWLLILAGLGLLGIGTGILVGYLQVKALRSEFVEAYARVQERVRSADGRAEPVFLGTQPEAGNRWEPFLEVLRLAREQSEWEFEIPVGHPLRESRDAHEANSEQNWQMTLEERELYMNLPTVQAILTELERGAHYDSARLATEEQRQQFEEDWPQCMALSSDILGRVLQHQRETGQHERALDLLGASIQLGSDLARRGGLMRVAGGASLMSPRSLERAFGGQALNPEQRQRLEELLRRGEASLPMVRQVLESETTIALQHIRTLMDESVREHGIQGGSWLSVFTRDWLSVQPVHELEFLEQQAFDALQGSRADVHLALVQLKEEYRDDLNALTQLLWLPADIVYESIQESRVVLRVIRRANLHPMSEAESQRLLEGIGGRFEITEGDEGPTVQWTREGVWGECTGYTLFWSLENGFLRRDVEGG